MSNGRLSSKIRKEFPVSLEEVSYKVLIEAYKILLKQEYDLDWEEEQFSQEIVRFMKKSKLRTAYKLTLGIERKLFDEDKPPISDNNPKKLPRIDINIVSWSFLKDVEQEYFFEAKNLSQTNWSKKSGSKVNASSSQRRYIDTGIENFRIGRYHNGSLVGYILNGNVDDIVKMLNIKLKKDRKEYHSSNSLSEFEKKSKIKDFDCYYETKHLTPSKKEIIIKHLFLKF